MTRLDVSLICLGIALTMAAVGLLWIWFSVRRERRDDALYRERFERNRPPEWWEGKR